MTQQVSVSLAKDSPTNMLAGSFKERIVEKKKTGQGVFHNDYYKLFHQNSFRNRKSGTVQGRHKANHTKAGQHSKIAMVDRIAVKVFSDAHDKRN
jgi:hypothetical protein